MENKVEDIPEIYNISPRPLCKRSNKHVAAKQHQLHLRPLGHWATGTHTSYTTYNLRYALYI